MEDRAARHVHFDRPSRVARRRYRDERDDQRVGGTARDPDVGIQPAKQHRVGKEVQIEREDAGETDAKRLDRPSRLGVGAPDQLLDQDETEDRKSEPHAERRGVTGRIENRVRTAVRRE